MDKKLIPARLESIRIRLGLNKTEAANLLRLTKMGYGRYESGDRSPSYQVMVYMAGMLGTSVAYLTGETEDPAADTVIVTSEEEPELFEISSCFRSGDEAFRERMLAYCRKLRERKEPEGE